jgi:hypothetical protein
MTLKEALKQLKALGNVKVRAQNAKSGAGDNQFGVSLGDIRALAKKIRTDHPLALSLWETGNVDVQFLAALLIQPKKLSPDEMERMVRSIAFVRVADWLVAYVVRQHPDKEALRQKWMPRTTAGRPAPDGTLPRSGSRRVRTGSISRRCWIASIRNGQRRSGSAMDDEHDSCDNRNPLPQTPQAGHRHRREVGNLSGLSRVEGLHVPLRPDLDQRNGEPARLNEHRRIAG